MFPWTVSKERFSKLKKPWLTLFVIAFFVAIYAMTSDETTIAIIAWGAFIVAAFMLWDPRKLRGTKQSDSIEG
ncbi:hypothetical protein CTEST_02625 [Corynebacterium testudinoris]|uniref:Uncharacterized protein n=1 Tax=Corynebacterium testudinoris TaxID=136857 RepID=A0A0G3H5F5_9CORY|nr:hypothetical protein CTEST_02625 [Corynebacterium testudinoris]